MIMESHTKNNFSSMDEAASRGTKEARGRNAVFLVLRVLALVLTLAATIVLGVDKQTKLVPIQLTPSLPAINVPVDAKWQYLSAYVLFLVANAIACTYAAISLMLSMSRKNVTMPILLTLDLLMVALLFSGNGAAMAIGLLAYEGNSHVRWNKVCNLFGKFCNQVAAALVLSLIGAVAFVLLITLTAFRLHNKSK